MAKNKPIMLIDSAEPGAVSISFCDAAVAKRVLAASTVVVPSKIAFMFSAPARSSGPWREVDRARLTEAEEAAFYGIVRACSHRPVAEGPARITIDPHAATNDNNWQATLNYAEHGEKAFVDLSHYLPPHLQAQQVKAGITQVQLDGWPDGSRAVNGLDVFLECPQRKHHFLVHRRPTATTDWHCNDTEELVRANLASGNMRSVIYDPRLATPRDLQQFFSDAALHMAVLSTRHLPDAPGGTLPITWKL